MGYHQVASNDIYDVYRRWHSGQSIRGIAASVGLDRKTIRTYIEGGLQAGVGREGELLSRAQYFAAVGEGRPAARRRRAARESLEPYEQELRALISDAREPLKPKTAWLVIRQKYELALSYETFKVFAREKRLVDCARKLTIRIEVAAGQETQLDYGKVGLLQDATTGRQRVVWAFVAVLAHSRLPFVQFVWTQSSQSFAESVIDMGEFYQGFTQTLRMDNLKAAVIKPDLWDPSLNRSLVEVAEHYGFFIDPCRVARPKEKGKVERQVPVARELFRRLKHLSPSASLGQLNAQAVQWSCSEYGMKRHGTTGARPWQVYQQTEKATLKELPPQRFEVGVWKPSTVHPDQFVTIKGKYYALPQGLRGKRLWTRWTPKFVRIFDGEHLVRTYPISQKLRSWMPGDFPEGSEQMMQDDYPRFLLNKAELYGPQALAYMRFLLQPHAYLNARRARAVLSHMDHYHPMPFFSSVCCEALSRHIRVPHLFKALCEDERQQIHLAFPSTISQTAQAMIRPIHYFFTPQGGLHGDTSSSGTASTTAENAGDAEHPGAATR